MIGWFLAIVSVLGIGGTLAAFYFAPAVAVPIVQATVTWLLGCKRCLYTLGIVTLCALAYYAGQYRASASCRAKDLEARIAAQNADIEAARNSASDAAQRAKAIEDQANERQTKDAEYIAKLKANPACALTSDDINGMRNSRKWHHIPIPPAFTK